VNFTPHGSTALAAGIDPLEQRSADRQAEAAKAAEATTFAEAARSVVAAHRAGWRQARGGKHAPPQPRC